MSPKPKVVITFPLDVDLVNKISAACTTHQLDSSSRQQLLADIRDAEGVLVHPGIKVDSEFFDAAPNLRVVSSASVGYDSYDIAEASKRGVVVCHTPGVLNAAVADMTMAMIITLARQLFPFERYVRTGAWARRETPPPLAMDIAGKTLAVIGFGRIGQEVTRRMQALGMKTTWFDIFDSAPAHAPQSDYRPLHQLLEEADFVSLHGDLNPSSYHLIGEAELALMKPSAYLVNTSRGPLVDQKALAIALQNKIIAGAALDVFEQEPPDVNDPIFTLENVICFPHVGTATVETRRAMRALAVENLLKGVTGESPLTPVNPEVLA